MRLVRQFLRWLCLRLPYVNLLLAGLAFLVNEFIFQVFCQPVLWATIVLISGTSAFLVWPWLGSWPIGWRYLALCLQGVLVLVCVYCLLFLGIGSLVFGLLFGFLLLPALAWVPVFFAGQALHRVWHSSLPGARWVFGLGMVSLVGAQLWAEHQYRAIEGAIARLPPAQRRQPAALLRVVPRTYMAERLAGTLFKYHNYLETYDGWRPPLHDPLANISLWARTGQQFQQPGVREANPLLVAYLDAPAGEPGEPLARQAAFYHQLFPQLPVKADCVCAQTKDGQSYREWEPPPLLE